MKLSAKRLNGILIRPSEVLSYWKLERNHEMKAEYWGGYSRHNELYQQRFSPDGALLDETLLVTNSAIMMYSPFLERNVAETL